MNFCIDSLWIDKTQIDGFIMSLATRKIWLYAHHRVCKLSVIIILFITTIIFTVPSFSIDRNKYRGIYKVVKVNPDCSSFLIIKFQLKILSEKKVVELN